MNPPTKDILDAAGIINEAHQFFILRWHEIFNEFTFDSWQVRSSNLKTILKEIITSCEIAEKMHAHHPNIELLIAEGIRAAQNDEVICQSFPFVHNYLKEIKSIYDNEIKNKEGSGTKVVKRRTQVILGNISSYQKRLFERLISIIATPPEKYKEKLYSLTLSLGIELTSIGYTLSELRDSLTNLLEPDEVDFTLRFNTFLNYYCGKTKHYTCHFHVSLPWKTSLKSSELLSENDIEITKERPAILETDAEKLFYSKDKKSFVVIAKTSALDAYSAKHICEQKIQEYFAISKIYKISQDVNFTGRIALIRQDNGHTQCIDIVSSQTKYIRDSGKPEYKISEFAKLLKQISKSDSSQLIASLQYHKLALTASTDESKFINMWIGLESLVQGVEGSTISRITTYIPPSNSLDYILQMMKFLPISFKELWRSKNTSDILEHLPHSSKYILHHSDMLSIFLSDPNGELVRKFCALMADSPLLLFRLNRIYKGYFESPLKLVSAIELHNKNINWQICRTYRARNRIMHQGGHLLRLRQLLQHIHTYYITTIHALIHDLKKNPSWSIADSFEHRKYLYNHFLYRLKNYQDNPLCAESLLHPDLILENRYGQPAWDVSEKL